MKNSNVEQLDNLDFKSIREPFVIPNDWSWRPLSYGLRPRKQFIQIGGPDYIHISLVTSDVSHLVLGN